MFATTALYPDDSKATVSEKLCIIFKTNDEHHIGNWVVTQDRRCRNLRFPKTSTRPLTPSERKEWSEQKLGRLAGLPQIVLPKKL